jgi:hypothetical protein
MDKTVLFSMGVFLCMMSPISLFSESSELEIGRFSFSVAPKILKDGSITDMDIGYRYGDNLSTSVRLRYSTISKIEKLLNIEDSRNVINEKILDVFLLPMQYYFFRKPEHELWLAGGIYYKWDRLDEKGHFYMPELETDPVNSFNNELSMHLTGPLADFGYSFRKKLFDITLYGGIVPVFFLHSDQHMSMVPLLKPHGADNSQNVFGSPYFYVSLDCVLLKYLNILGQYELAKMAYQVIDFDSNLKWILSEQKVMTHSIKLEASLLLPFSETVRFQIGYGYIHDLINFESGANIVENRHYIILSAKKNRN